MDKWKNDKNGINGERKIDENLTKETTKKQQKNDKNGKKGQMTKMAKMAKMVKMVETGWLGSERKLMKFDKSVLGEMRKVDKGRVANGG